MKECDVLVVGAGPGGLAAACAAKQAGAENVIILERDVRVGGILNQCIHNGFGLIRYHAELTGPEYAERAMREAIDDGVTMLTERHVSRISKMEDGNTVAYIVSAYTRNGIEKYKSKTIILATGCRERTRGNISIPGSRPAGVFTAGVAQNLVNCHNVMIGKRVVILGSGDIGLIMARRLTLEGAKVLAIAEIMSEPTGLARNVSQCVLDFSIPLYVKTTVSKIIGKQKLEAVELSALDENGHIIRNSAKRIDCDALVLSVGLIPENEVATTVGVELLPNNAVNTDVHLQTSVPGIFACGNSRHVMDLADYVSEQGAMAGRNAVHLIKGKVMESWDEGKSNCMKKGFPEEGMVTCTICPNGCQVHWDAISKSYIGNRCERGAILAEQERIDPRRTVTSTVKRVGNEKHQISVKTDRPVRRADVPVVMQEIQKITVTDTMNLGDEIASVRIGKEAVRILVTTSGKQKIMEEQK